MILKLLLPKQKVFQKKKIFNKPIQYSTLAAFLYQLADTRERDGLLDIDLSAGIV